MRAIPSVIDMTEIDRTRAVWRQVAAILEARIADGTYPPGSRVPSVLELHTEFDIAASTAQRVMAHLRDAGLIRSEVGIGTFVMGPGDDA